MKITLSVEMPDGLLQEFMQTIRNFDTKYDPEHEDKIVVHMLTQSGHTLEELKTVLSGVHPQMKETKVIKLDS